VGARRALRHRHEIEASVDEPEWVHDVDDDLAVEEDAAFGEKALQRLERYGEEHDVRLRHCVAVPHAVDARDLATGVRQPSAELRGGFDGALRGARAEQHRVTRGRETEAETPTELAGAADERECGEHSHCGAP
jgi:hypothetical protein